MSDQIIDDLLKQVQAGEIEINRCDATIHALWTELIRLARLGTTAWTEYQHLTEVESERAGYRCGRVAAQHSPAQADRVTYPPGGSIRRTRPRVVHVSYQIVASAVKGLS